MKKSLLLSAFTAVLSFGAMAQNYYYYKTVGDPSGYSMTVPAGATTILAGTSTAQANTLSAAQTLPFSWDFYGFNASSFKVSTSGYITFDPSATTDNSSNVALPDVAAPKMSIFAFWDNTRIQTVTQGQNTFPSGMKSWTYGTAPNRHFVVQWQLIQTNDGSNVTNITYYAAIINEAGGFDIVHNYGFGNFAATVGVQNIDGTIGRSVTGSPNMNFGGSNGSLDPKMASVYHFVYGTQPTFDLHVKASLTPEVTAKGTATTIKVTAANYGSTDITTAKMHYTTNGGPAGGVVGVTPVSMANSGGAADISHPSAFVPGAATAGTNVAIKVWFTEINAGSSISADTLTFNLFVNNGVTGSKKVLIEEGSGAWCGYCVDGHYRLKTILEDNPSTVFAGVHHNSDAMVNTYSNEFNSTYATGYPYGTVDRKKFDGQDEVGMDRGQWATKAADQLNATTPVNVSIINKTFDWALGKVTYTVKVDFVDFAQPGDLRIGTMVIENKVRGAKVSATSTQWNQHNYYTFEYGDNAAGGPEHPLYTEPEYIIGYYHNEVVRAIPSTTWGTAGVITNPAPGQSYTYTYTHQMQAANSVSYPAEVGFDDTEFRSTKSGRGWNKYEDTKLIAFVSYYNADVNKREILNVAQANMINTAVEDVKENPIGAVSVYPNPVSSNATVNFTMNTTSNVQVEVINVVGQKVATLANRTYAAGEHSVFFSTENIENGIYFVTVSSAEGKSTYRFVVTK